MASRAQVVDPRGRWFYVFAAVLIAAIIFAGFLEPFISTAILRNWFWGTLSILK
jgi:hypothetical protein